MFKARRFLGSIAVALLATLLWATVALGAPVEWKSLDLTIHSDQQQTTFMVYGGLPDEAKLPQDAELAVPEGAQLQWIGELLGGDLSQDPEVKYEKSTVDGLDIYSFKMTKGRQAQVETVLPLVTSFDGTSYKTGLTWKAWRDIPEVRISQRIPSSAKIVQTDPDATLQTDDATYSYYTKTLKNVKKGDDVTLAFSYALPAAAASTTTSGTAGNDRLIIGLIGIAFIAGVMFLIMNVQRKAAEKREAAQPEKKKSAAATARAEKSAPAAARAHKSGRNAADEDVDEEPQAGGAASKTKVLWPMFLVLAAIVGGFIFASSNATSTAAVNGKITRDFGTASACQAGTVKFTANQGVDLAKEGDKLLKVFEGKEGVGVITIDLEQSKIDLAWCESSQTPESMQQALTSTGLVTLSDFVQTKTDQ